MEDIFLNVLNMSIAASGLILVVIFARFCLKKAPRWSICLLWALVAIRLVCPFAPISDWSRIPASISDGSLLSDWRENYVGENYMIHSDSPDYETAVRAGRMPIEQPDGSFYVVTAADRKSPPATVADTLLPLFARLWLGGVLLLTVYAAAGSYRLYRMVRERICLRENIYLCDNVQSPFILGILRPRIFLPSGLSGSAAESVIAHEKAHLRRLDHIWKPLAFLILTLHWFNPLCILAYILLCRDIELACDERVIREMDLAQRKEYSAALVDLSVLPQGTAICPLAFGEIGVKMRVKNILNYKKPAGSLIVLAVLVVLISGVSFLTNPLPSKAAAPTIESDAGELRDFTKVHYGAGNDEDSQDNTEDALERAVSQAILTHYEGKKGIGENGDLSCESHITLATEVTSLARGGGSETITIYVIMLYEEYAYAGAGFDIMQGSLGPAALTFDVADDGSYQLKEYFEPRDGAYYEPDIRKRFPSGVAREALASSHYAIPLKQANYAQAVAHAPEKVDTDFLIGQYLDTILTDPMESSNPDSYIKRHDLEYEELIYFGDYTLRYCFREFLKGGQTDLRGQIMLRLIKRLAPELAVTTEASNGQAQFDAIKEKVEKTYQAHGAEWMQENMPHGWLLIRMMGED